MEIKFIITIGISGSGKSRWINSLNDSNYVVISPDQIRKELTGSISNQSLNNEVFAIAHKRIINTLNKGMSVIFDATNTVSYHRRKLLYILKDVVIVDFNAYAKLFDVEPDICKERVKNDIKNNIDRSNVPSDVINRQYQQLLKDISKITDDGYTLIE